jgi:integrase
VNDSTASKPKPAKTRRGRGQGEGSIYSRLERRERADGSVREIERWRAVIDLGIIGGKRMRKYLSGGTRAEVARKLNTILHDRDRGRTPDVDQEHTQLGTWLNDWLETVVRRARRPNTYRNYEQSVRVHIIKAAPSFARKRLVALRRSDVQAWIGDRERDGLSPRTIHRLWAVLHSALQHAVRTERLTVNPASEITLPRLEKQEPRAMPLEQARRLLQAVAGEPDGALYALVLTTGLRQGELLGLRWAKDEHAPGVDLKRGEVRVTEQLQLGELAPLKRGSSRRMLRLRPWLVDVLRAHHAYLDRLQLKAGQHWHPNNLVFPSQVGTPRSAGNMWLSWKRLLKRLGLPDYKFHELRHTAASLAIAEGASLFHVSRLLGHSSIAITADTYGHLTDEGREDVAARMERALVGPLALAERG